MSGFATTYRHQMTVRYVQDLKRHGRVIVHQPEPLQAEMLCQLPGIEPPTVVGHGNDLTGYRSGNGQAGLADSHRPCPPEVFCNRRPRPRELGTTERLHGLQERKSGV